MSVLKEVTLYKNHGGTVGDWTIQAVADPSGTAELVIIHTKVVGGKAVPKAVPVTGKNIGRANETTPAQQAVMELDSRVNKQLDKGYVRTVEEAAAPATNSLGLRKPMLAQPIDKMNPEILDWADAFAQPKLDGHRCLTKDVLYSRNGKLIELPHIRDALGDLGLLRLHLDGELYIHGMPLQDIGSLVKRPRPESLQLEYHLYDAMINAPYRERHAMLVDAFGAPLEGCPIKLVETVPVGSREDLNRLHHGFRARKYEGTILRWGKESYQDDKRSQYLLKLKDYDEAEFRVIGYKAGTPNGQFGTYQVPVWLLENPHGVDEESRVFEATAHGDMYKKHAQWELRHTYIGRQLTVQFFCFSKKGVPLQPVALRWREDV